MNNKWLNEIFTFLEKLQCKPLYAVKYMHQSIIFRGVGDTPPKSFWNPSFVAITFKDKYSNISHIYFISHLFYLTSNSCIISLRKTRRNKERKRENFVFFLLSNSHTPFFSFKFSAYFPSITMRICWLWTKHILIKLPSFFLHAYSKNFYIIILKMFYLIHWFYPEVYHLQKLYVSEKIIENWKIHK